MRYSKAEWDILREKIVQDLIAGVGVRVIVENHGVTEPTVHKVMNEDAQRIEDGQRVILEKRQAEIDAFLEDETQALLRICRKTTQLLEQSLDEKIKMSERGDDRIPTEYEAISTTRDKDKDGKAINKRAKVKSKPIHDVDTAMKQWKEAHDMLFKAQNNAED